LIDDVRRATENEGVYDDAGLKDEAFVELLNRAQGRLFSRLFSRHPDDFIVHYTPDIEASTEAYTLPAACFLDNSLMLVEWLFDSDDYVRLRPDTLASRYTDEEGDPEWYIVKNNKILLNPIPDRSITDGLRITYRKKPRELDKRRGYVGTATLSGTTLQTLTLADPSTLLSKDADLDDASEAVLQKIDYVCIVDKDGASVLDSIPVDDYNTSTRVLTMSSGFTTSLDASDLEDNYIVAGYYATSHCELPDNYERYLLAYLEQAIHARDGNSEESLRAINEVRAYENDILKAASTKTDPMDPVLDDHWEPID